MRELGEHTHGDHLFGGRISYVIFKVNVRDSLPWGFNFLNSSFSFPFEEVYLSTPDDQECPAHEPTEGENKTNRLIL